MVASFRNTGSIVKHGGNRACYVTEPDFIMMPEFRRFVGPAEYYSTLGHEHTHWTGRPSRCNRDLGKRFGVNAWAVEEITAESRRGLLVCQTRNIE
jgi:antirestriction protein ArdC